MERRATQFRTLRKDQRITQMQLERALLTAAKLILRYEGTEFEDASIDLFERLENELQNLDRRDTIRQRSAAMLKNRCDGHLMT